MSNPLESLIPRGSIGLKLLLVCVLVVAMGVPLLAIGGVLVGRQARAMQVTNEIGARAGGPQIVTGPMLLVPYARNRTVADASGWQEGRVEHGLYAFFPKTGAANAALNVTDRRRGIYRAAVYQADTRFHAEFDVAQAVAALDSSYRLDWNEARIGLYVSDSRALQDATELTFGDGTKAPLEPSADGSQSVSGRAPATAATQPFTVDTQLKVGGAQRFAFSAFALNTSTSISGNRRDVSASGFIQSVDPLTPDANGFRAAWRAPHGNLRGIDMASAAFADLQQRDMAVGFVSSDDLYVGVARAVSYGILFIGLVFLATLIFEAVSGKRAHPAQYVLVGLAQSVFYLLLLSISEILGFSQAFAIAATATVLLLSYYAGASARSAGVGVMAFIGLCALYGAMYVLLTLEDFALLAGSLVAFLAIAGAMIATRRINWYGKTASAA